MVWSTPKTWVAGSIVTEGHLNTYIRDSLKETMPAKATTAGQIFVTTGLNALAARQPSIATVATAQTTSSTTYTDLATVGPSVTVTTGTRALCLFSCRVEGNIIFVEADARATVVVESVWFDDVADRWAIIYNDFRSSDAPFRGMSAHLFTDLAPGSNTFTMKYRLAFGDQGTFSNRTLVVVPL